jgi:hypothetical protein
VSRQIGRLIESAALATPPVQRYRHREIGAGEHAVAVFAHQTRERLCQRATPVVLEGVHNGAKRAVVMTNGAREVERRSRPAAARANGERAERPPRPERIATRQAKRRRQGPNRLPAGRADRTARGSVERFVAGQARRGDDHREQRVERRSSA